jgi:hypothetical protein
LLFNPLYICFDDTKLGCSIFFLHVDDRSESIVFDYLFHYELLVALFFVFIPFDIEIRLDISLIISKFQKKIKQSTLEVSLVNDLVDQVINEYLALIWVGVAFNDFRDEVTCINTLVDHINKETQVFEQVLLDNGVVVAACNHKIDNILEQVSIVKHLILQLHH